MSTTPYMNLTLPTASVTEGPDYAEQNTTAFETVDAHDHTSGKGTPVPAAGLDIDTDLDFQTNKAVEVGAVNLISQASSLPATNSQSVYSITGDLWYNNSSGTPVQITQGSSIASASSPLVPTGVIWPYGGSSAPTGFLLCDGTAISRVTYSALFAILGTTYGVGDGSTTFGLPNSKGRVPVGAGNYTDPVSGSVTRVMGASSGAEKHQLVTNELAGHQHTLGNHRHFQYTNASVSGNTSVTNTTSPLRARSAGDASDYSTITSGTDVATVGLTSEATGNTGISGADIAHNNMQPYFVTNYIIKT